MNIVEEMKAGLEKALANSLQASRDSGAIRNDQAPQITVEAPREKDHGDFATNLAMLLATGLPGWRRAGQLDPGAKTFCRDLGGTGEIAGPGFTILP